MIDCGFVTMDIIWAVTSINTVEFIRVMDAVCFIQLSQVSHPPSSASISSSMLKLISISVLLVSP